MLYQPRQVRETQMGLRRFMARSQLSVFRASCYRERDFARLTRSAILSGSLERLRVDSDIAPHGFAEAVNDKN
jgi:hypothetical protein